MLRATEEVDAIPDASSCPAPLPHKGRKSIPATTPSSVITLRIPKRDPPFSTSPPPSKRRHFVSNDSAWDHEAVPVQVAMRRRVQETSSPTPVRTSRSPSPSTPVASGPRPPASSSRLPTVFSDTIDGTGELEPSPSTQPHTDSLDDERFVSVEVDYSDKDDRIITARNAKQRSRGSRGDGSLHLTRDDDLLNLSRDHDGLSAARDSELMADVCDREEKEYNTTPPIPAKHEPPSLGTFNAGKQLYDSYQEELSMNDGGIQVDRYSNDPPYDQLLQIKEELVDGVPPSQRWFEEDARSASPVDYESDLSDLDDDPITNDHAAEGPSGMSDFFIGFQRTHPTLEEDEDGEDDDHIRDHITDFVDEYRDTMDGSSVHAGVEEDLVDDGDQSEHSSPEEDGNLYVGLAPRRALDAPRPEDEADEDLTSPSPSPDPCALRWDGHLERDAALAFNAHVERRVEGLADENACLKQRLVELEAAGSRGRLIENGNVTSRPEANSELGGPEERWPRRSERRTAGLPTPVSETATVVGCHFTSPPGSPSLPEVMFPPLENRWAFHRQKDVWSPPPESSARYESHRRAEVDAAPPRPSLASIFERPGWLGVGPSIAKQMRLAQSDVESMNITALLDAASALNAGYTSVDIIREFEPTGEPVEEAIDPAIHAGLQARFDALQEAKAGVERRLAAVTEQLSAADAARESALLDSAKSVITRLDGEKASLEKRVKSMTTTNKEAEKRGQDLSTQLTTAQAATDEARSERDNQARLAKTQKVRADKLENEVKALKDRLTASASTSADMRNEVAAALAKKEQRIAALEDKIKRLETVAQNALRTLAAKEAEHKRLRNDAGVALTAHIAENDRLDVECRKLEVENKRLREVVAMGTDDIRDRRENVTSPPNSPDLVVRPTRPLHHDHHKHPSVLPTPPPRQRSPIARQRSPPPRPRSPSRRQALPQRPPRSPIKLHNASSYFGPPASTGPHLVRAASPLPTHTVATTPTLASSAPRRTSPPPVSANPPPSRTTPPPPPAGTPPPSTPIEPSEPHAIKPVPQPDQPTANVKPSIQLPLNVLNSLVAQLPPSGGSAPPSAVRSHGVPTPPNVGSPQSDSAQDGTNGYFVRKDDSWHPFAPSDHRAAEHAALSLPCHPTPPPSVSTPNSRDAHDRRPAANGESALNGYPVPAGLAASNGVLILKQEPDGHAPPLRNPQPLNGVPNGGRPESERTHSVITVSQLYRPPAPKRNPSSNGPPRARSSVYSDPHLPDPSLQTQLDPYRKRGRSRSPGFIYSPSRPIYGEDIRDPRPWSRPPHPRRDDEWEHDNRPRQRLRRETGPSRPLPEGYGRDDRGVHDLRDGWDGDRRRSHGAWKEPNSWRDRGPNPGSRNGGGGGGPGPRERGRIQGEGRPLWHYTEA